MAKKKISKESPIIPAELSAKQKALQESLKQLAASGIIVRRMGDTKISKNTKFIPTGSMLLDMAIGIGGYPCSRIVELVGMESSGKSLLSLLAIAEVQKAGGTAALIDVEHAFDATWAKKLGVNVDDLLISQPDFGEAALEAVEKLAASNAVDLIVVDSTAALVPKAEVEGEMTTQHIGLQARMLSKAFRRITGPLGKSTAVALFINQLRINPMQQWGDKFVSPGGLALKFYSSVRIQVKRLSGAENTFLDAAGSRIGHTIHFKVIKNKVSAPFREGEFDLYYETGIDKASELAPLLLEKGIVVLDGKTYSYKEHSWLGHPKYLQALRDDKQLYQVLLKEHIDADSANSTS